jgi:hypothetical protein
MKRNLWHFSCPVFRINPFSKRNFDFPAPPIYTSPLHQFSKFNNFLWKCWLFGKSLSNFLTLLWNSTTCISIKHTYGGKGLKVTKFSRIYPLTSRNTLKMALPVMEFQDQGYKIKKGFWIKINLPKWNYWILRIGLTGSISSLQITVLKVDSFILSLFLLPKLRSVAKN